MAEKEKPGRWRLTVSEGGDEKDYVFVPKTDVTVSALRQIKAWFPDIGRYIQFYSAFLEGDPDAALCALWIARKKAGETEVPEPNKLGDFAIGGFYEAIGDEDEDEESDPTSGAATPTPSSTRTPTSSESATSDRSPTSAT
jgi:hypothetical protein